MFGAHFNFRGIEVTGPTIFQVTVLVTPPYAITLLEKQCVDITLITAGHRILFPLTLPGPAVLIFDAAEFDPAAP